MDISPNEWISYKEMNRRSSTDMNAKVDPDMSHIVGREVRVNDPRLIALVVKWKKKMSLDPNGTVAYNFKGNSGFVEELRQVFNGS